MENWRLFWAKTNREKIAGLPDDWTHPLWAHLIDVGSAAQVLWEQFLPPSLKRKMAGALGMEPDEAGRFLSIWIGLHDLGKGIPSFQGNIDDKTLKAAVVRKLAAAGLHIQPDAVRLHHGHVSIAIAHLWLKSQNFDDQTLDLLGVDNEGEARLEVPKASTYPYDCIQHGYFSDSDSLHD